MWATNKDQKLPLLKVSRNLLPGCITLAHSFLKNICEDVVVEEQTVRWNPQTKVRDIHNLLF
jgi:hypothetical protein